MDFGEAGQKRMNSNGDGGRVKFAADALMPEGHQWVICRASGEAVLYLSQSVRTLSDEQAAAVLEEAWAGYRELAKQVPAKVPPQRLSGIELRQLMGLVRHG